ncbi:MAG TPA: hypothetical protein VE152_03530 [Acidimicrobiales bacterium]|jgi:hypothetical protein|nr:hypothetical protein [Acidimicrobiales bacterium]
MAADDRESPDLGAYLEHARAEAHQTIAGYRSDPDLARMGAHLRVLVGQLSNLQEVRDDTLRRSLRNLDDDADYLRRYDEARQHLLEVLLALDDRSAGVGPRDVLQSRPAWLDALVQELSQRMTDVDHFEATELVPFLEERLGPDSMAELGRRAVRVRRHGMSHTHTGFPPADERSRLGRAVAALMDRLDDSPTHADEALQEGGEEGP